MNRKAQGQWNAQHRAYARVDRMLAKAHRRSSLHQQERAEFNRPRHKKCLKDRVILINVIGGFIVYSLGLFASYGKQIVVNIDPTSLANALDYCRQLVGI